MAAMVHDTMQSNGKATSKHTSQDNRTGQWMSTQTTHVCAEKAAASEDVFVSMARLLAGEQMLAACQCAPAQRPEMISKSTCRIGHYTQSQIIANLLHLAVQLALFQDAAGKPTTDQACQTTLDQSVQTTEDVGCQASPPTASQSLQTVNEQECQTVNEQECQTTIHQECQAGIAGKLLVDVDGEVNLLKRQRTKKAKEPAEEVETREVEYSTQAVRVGGGFHVVRQLRRPAPSSSLPLTSQQPRLPSRLAQVDPDVMLEDKSSTDEQHPPVSINPAEVRVDHNTSTDVTDDGPRRLIPLKRDSFAHGQPSRDTQLERYKVGSYKTGHNTRRTPEEERLYRVMRDPPQRGAGPTCMPGSASLRQPHSARQASMSMYPMTGGTS